MLEPSIQDKRRWWHSEDILLLALLGMLFFLPGLGRIPLFDRDEPRFAVAARTMLQTGDYIVPRFNGALRPDKPPLVYWLMDLGYQITGALNLNPELGARLPSAISGTLTLLVIYFMVGMRFGRLTGFISAMMAGSSALFVVESRLATADGTMLFFITSCMALAWRAWDAAPKSPGDVSSLPRTDYLLDRVGKGSPMMLDHLPTSAAKPMPFLLAILFWISLAAGTLTKGVPLAFVLIPMIVLSLTTGALPGHLRQWRTHLHHTRRRIAIALTIAVLVLAYVFAAPIMPFPDRRSGVAVFGLLLCGMILTPGLPGLLARCLWFGNWSWWRQLRPLLGIPVLIALVGWWVYLAGQATHWKLIADMVGTHFLARIGVPAPDMTTGGTQTAMKAYSQPPGFYLVTVWATFWPWSILLIPAAYHTLRRLRGKMPISIDARPYQFLVAWIIPMWILLELSRGKLFHYPLPLYIPIAILCADTLVQSWNRLTDVLAAPWVHSMRWVVLGIWTALGAAVLVGARMRGDDAMLWRCFPFAIALMATGIVSAVTWGKPSWPYVVALGWGGTLLVASSLVLGDLPDLQVSRIAGRIMADAKARNPSVQLAVCGYEEATLVFYSGANVTRFGSAHDITEAVPFGPTLNPADHPYVIVVDDKTRAQLDESHVQYTTLSRLDTSLSRLETPENLATYQITGFNAATFRPVHVSVISNVVPLASAPAGQH